MQIIKRMLLENRTWARAMIKRDPAFFLRNADRQSPEVLWLGCSDSRVPAEYIINAAPGELFVHRNIANLAVASDLNMMSVLQYAVVELGVKHIIVCGHHGCGGVRASMAAERADLPDLPYVSRKLKPLRRIYQRHCDEIDRLPEETARVNRLVELNVLEQVRNLTRNSVIRQAWRTSARPFLHGWVYNIRDGLLAEIVTANAATSSDTLTNALTE